MRHRAAEWAVAIAAISVGLSAAMPIFVFERVSQDRRAQNCASRQNLWEGEVGVIDLIGNELGASPARIALAVDHFAKGHPRPEC